MAFEAPIEKYQGKIREITIGAGNSHVIIGGENTLPFYLFEGEMLHKPAIAMEVYDAPPENWPAHLLETLGDVINDPALWAKKCQDEYQADLICLQLASTDPNGLNRSPEEAASIVKSVLEAVSIPLMVYGSGNSEKDTQVLKKVAEATQGHGSLLGPAVEDNYKSIAAAALGYQQNVAAQTPNDVNMAKQLNVLITQLGLAPERIVIDPSTGALGYGIEYTYSIIERLKLAALQQDDDMTQMPILSDLGKEVWKTKEAKVTQEEEPRWGDAKKRGILWEAMTAMTLITAGSNLVIMRHPEAVKIVKEAIERLMGE